MYKIEMRKSGFFLTFGGFIGKEEMSKWLVESQRLLADAQAPFGAVIDMRTLLPLPSDAQTVMVAGQKLYKAAGMERSAVILADSIITLQFRRLAKESGIHTWERYIDASSQPDWELAAEQWIRNRVDPGR